MTVSKHQVHAVHAMHADCSLAILQPVHTQHAAAHLAKFTQHAAAHLAQFVLCERFQDDLLKWSWHTNA